jgi:hypothetical protein
VVQGANTYTVEATDYITQTDVSVDINTDPFTLEITMIEE